ncbi:hypothetical protein EUX98_g9617, partial [Antrodiella citrinella]
MTNSFTVREIVLSKPEIRLSFRHPVPDRAAELAVFFQGHFQSNCPKIDKRQPEPLPTLDTASFFPIPDANTATRLGDIDLLTYNLAINTTTRVAVCTKCKLIVRASNIRQHVTSDLPQFKIPAYLQAELIQTYDLREHVEIPEHASLRSHQQASGHISHYQSYAQYVGNRIYLPVQAPQYPDKNPLFSIDYENQYNQSIMIVRDYSKHAVAQAEDEMNMQSFFHDDGWLYPLTGLIPADIADARRTHLTGAEHPIEVLGPQLLQLAEQYLGSIQAFITEHITFGLMSVLGQTTERSESVASFRRLDDSSIKKYANVLHRLIFNCMRFYIGGGEEWTSPFKYPPLSPIQVDAMSSLRRALEEQLPTVARQEAFERCVYLLLCHEKTEYAETRMSPRFFSPVISFTILHSLDINKDTCATVKASKLTQIIAKLMYAVRASVLFAAVREHESRPECSVVDLVKSRTRYFKDQYETPLSFMFNAVKRLVIIRDMESHESQFRWLGPEEVSYQGHPISFSDVRSLVHTAFDDHETYMRRELMFGREQPPQFDLPVDIERLVEDESSRVVGYTFVDDPRNNLSQYKALYGQWIMSLPDIRDQLFYTDGKKLLLKTDTVLGWLRCYARHHELLLAALTFSAGPSARSTEVCRYIYRDMPGTPRNVGLVGHNISLNSTQDKTSHRCQKDLFVPHIPTGKGQRQLLFDLLILRPFAEWLVERVFPHSSETVRRYQHYLFPGITSHMHSESLRDTMKEASEQVIGVALAPTLWRAFVTVVFRSYATQAESQTQRDYYYDRANMHSTTTADKHYSGSGETAPGVQPKSVLEFLRVTHVWQDVMRLNEDNQDHPDNTRIPFPTDSQLSLPTAGLTLDMSLLVPAVQDSVKETIQAKMDDLTVYHYCVDKRRPRCPRRCRALGASPRPIRPFFAQHGAASSPFARNGNRPPRRSSRPTFATLHAWVALATHRPIIIAWISADLGALGGVTV